MNRFEALERRYESLQPRERLLLALATGVLLVVGLHAFWIGPRADAGRAAREEAENLRPQVESLRLAVGRLEAELARDPELARREALERLRAEAAALDAGFLEDGRRVIAPQRMAGLLREMLGRDQRLRVQAVRVLAPEVLHWPAVPAGATVTGLPMLYRHRVELRFEGSYAGALDYVRALEALPYRLRLRRLDIDAERWPALQIRVEVETLGLGEGWIGA
ncbi:MAG: hypothetical protein KGZ52_11815 [Xanthomonadaceae bacterium]|jgi:MSHA biogenesis protein MshJ|nr:hypothetical protein [Xanthomonadaceae bacterium]